ncbi:hypothetical protein TUBRATIS_13480 [Tubulinosema ratisbonensis]|uniref:Phosphoribulokinase/uridine kinase domain-containing protein n=1 Tax=Tubulinosema ratisbonensis TaxID=291195 RepID=A0A437ALV2_9MICR|nr:hypothetical protein TUBRATIS_13480 [Tubulinosema ratisbonensis]
MSLTKNKYLEEITNKFKDTTKINVISIQGPSASGKSTLSKMLYFLLVCLNQKCFVINLDKFLKTKEKNDLFYDYDNPGCYQWDKITRLLEAFDRNEPKLEVYEYYFKESLSTGPIFKDNPRPAYLIVEGLHANYLFSNQFFNLQTLNPTIKLESISHLNEFVPQTQKYINFNVLKFSLKISEQKMVEIRTKRDIKERNLTPEKVSYLLKMVWPATLRWVYRNEITKPDIEIDEGTFNVEEVRLVYEAFVRFLVMKNEFKRSDWESSIFKLRISKILKEIN